MFDGTLDTTNLFLGILAAVSVLQALVVIGMAMLAYRLYSRAMQMVAGIEERQIAPLVARVNTLMSTVDGILGDVKGMTNRVTRRTERVEAAIDDTIHRVDETAGRVRASMTSGIQGLVGAAHAVAAGVQSLVHVRRAA